MGRCMKISKQHTPCSEMKIAHSRSTTRQLLTDTQLTASSVGLGWRGLQLDVCHNVGFHAEELLFEGHFVGIHLGPEPLTIRVPSGDGWCELTFSQHALWIHPRGRPFSANHNGFSSWAGAVIDDAFLDAVMGDHCSLNEAVMIQDRVLSSLLIALVSLITDHDQGIVCNSNLSASLVHSFVASLGSRHANVVHSPARRGGIAPHKITVLQNWLRENIGENLRVDDMAAQVGLSTAHFSREFRREMGVTPWGYVLALRLEIAVAGLKGGEHIYEVASRCGFSSRSHLCRALRQHLGITVRELLIQH